MASYDTLIAKLTIILRDWPDDRKDEECPGMGMSWEQLARLVLTVRKKRSRTQRGLGLAGRARTHKLLDQAVECGLIKLRHEERA